MRSKLQGLSKLQILPFSSNPRAQPQLGFEEKGKMGSPKISESPL